MSDNFEVGELDPTLIGDLTNSSVIDDNVVDGGGDKIRVEKFKVCDVKLTDYIPCLDNLVEINKLNSTERGENYERHCPGEGKSFNCIVPRPNGYQIRIPWPQSRDEVLSESLHSSFLFM